MNSFKTKYRSVFFVVLCSLLFCACTQETKAPLENVAPLSETATETTTEKEELSAPPQETETPNLSGAKNADETLALLIKDEGFRERVRYGTDLAEDDPPEKVLQKLENCESIMLDEPGRGNPIYSLESLSLLPNLKRLVIRISQWDESVITDFTPIAQLSHLEQLYISYEKDEQIDLSFLGGMHTITELFLTQCKVTDFSFLEQMSQLQRLSLYETPVDDLAVLENLPQLVELALSGNKNAAHMETVGTLTKMQDLGIQDCGIEDISFLSGLTELRCVNLNNNSVTDLTPLAGLDKLERLGLSENGIKDISVLKNLHNLFDLALDKNEIQDISALAQLPNLNQVGISNNQIEDLSPLAGKKDLMYAAVFGNPVKNIEPVWEVPMLSYTNRGATEEQAEFAADWLAQLYPEAEQFECIDFIEGDLNNDGRQDIAFVVDNTFDMSCRLMFILLQQKDGSWAQQGEARSLMTNGGVRGDPYYGTFIQPGYLLLTEGWGSSSGTIQTEIYQYRSEGLSLIKRISLHDCNHTIGYDVEIENEQTDTWHSYAIAFDGSYMARVDLADSEHPMHKAFPRMDIYDRSYYIYSNKIETQITSQEALDRVCEWAADHGDLAVQEKLPYASWQKEAYELLLGASLPDYYYILPHPKSSSPVQSSEQTEDGYLFYDGMVKEKGDLCHVICLKQDKEKTIFLLNDTDGTIHKTDNLWLMR